MTYSNVIFLHSWWPQKAPLSCVVPPSTLSPPRSINLQNRKQFIWFWGKKIIICYCSYTPFCKFTMLQKQWNTEWKKQYSSMQEIFCCIWEKQLGFTTSLSFQSLPNAHGCCLFCRNGERMGSCYTEVFWQWNTCLTQRTIDHYQ